VTGCELDELIAPAVEERIRTDQERAEPLLDKSLEGYVDVAFGASVQKTERPPTCARCGLYFFCFGFRVRIFRVDEHGDGGGAGHRRDKQLQPFRRCRRLGRECRNSAAARVERLIRDVADSDLVHWIDQQLAAADAKVAMNVATARDALIAPLRNVYGVSDKVLAMALSALLMGAGERRPLWFKVGATFIVIDTLVHNFLHRTGILRRFGADHAYGSGCYRPGGCCEILELIAARIDASEFNPAFPTVFPRFIQSAVWRYCAEGGLDVCNGNRIRDESRCDNIYCRLHSRCDRIALQPKKAENAQNIA
jgi:hypothetical protein